MSLAAAQKLSPNRIHLGVQGTTNDPFIPTTMGTLNASHDVNTLYLTKPPGRSSPTSSRAYVGPSHLRYGSREQYTDLTVRYGDWSVHSQGGRFSLTEGVLSVESGSVVLSGPGLTQSLGPEERWSPMTKIAALDQVEHPQMPSLVQLTPDLHPCPARPQSGTERPAGPQRANRF